VFSGLTKRMSAAIRNSTAKIPDIQRHAPDTGIGGLPTSALAACSLI
jgi:hypothetical protein